MSVSRRPLALALAGVLAAVMAAGCSRSGDELPREPVSGVVNLDGRPLDAGSIQFTPASPAPGAGGAAVTGGSSIENGRFAIDRENGLVPGGYKVAIYAADSKEPAATKGPVRKGTVLARERIPAKYNSRSTLTAEVKIGGTSDLMFDLQSE